MSNSSVLASKNRLEKRRGGVKLPKQDHHIHAGLAGSGHFSLNVELGFLMLSLKIV